MPRTFLLNGKGLGAAGSFELAKLITDYQVETIIRNLRQIKNDETTFELQNEFYDLIEEGFSPGQ